MLSDDSGLRAEMRTLLFAVNGCDTDTVIHGPRGYAYWYHTLYNTVIGTFRLSNLTYIGSEVVSLIPIPLFRAELPSHRPCLCKFGSARIPCKHITEF